MHPNELAYRRRWERQHGRPYPSEPELRAMAARRWERLFPDGPPPRGATQAARVPQGR